MRSNWFLKIWTLDPHLKWALVSFAKAMNPLYENLESPKNRNQRFKVPQLLEIMWGKIKWTKVSRFGGGVLWLPWIISFSTTYISPF
jgi:hypothetical protein